jgi:hypothetical protein
MAEPFIAVALFAGISATSIVSDVSINCLYDVLKYGAGGAGSGLQQRIVDMRASGELPTNHTLERGLRRAAINATLSVLMPIKPDDLADYLSVEHGAQSQKRSLARTCRHALKSANDELITLRNLYRHEGWDTPRRQKRLTRELDRMKLQIEKIDGHRQTTEAALASVSANAEAQGDGVLGALMLEVTLQFAALDYEIAERMRDALKERFEGDSSEFETYFPLFFAQELKEDPALNAVLLHQRLGWNAEKVNALKSNMEDLNKSVLDQADLIMNAFLRQNRKLEELVRSQSRNARPLSEILSTSWLLDAKARGEFNSMFRTPSARRSSAVVSEDDVLRFHFSSEDDEFVGREDQLRRIEAEFLAHPQELQKETDAFRWMVISGEAGTGKSRLAQEVIRRNRGVFRHSGFASDTLLEDPRFGIEQQDRFKHPILIVVDYTVGHQDKMSQLMKGWAEYGRAAMQSGKPPVRIILLLRRPDDRVLRDITSLGGNHADRLVADGQRFGDVDRMELKKLDRSETIELMRARIRQTAERFDRTQIDISNGEDLLLQLNRFDVEQRPLFALMVAHALQRGSLPGLGQTVDQETARLELFSTYLKGQWTNFWRSRTGLPAFKIAEADEIVIPHVNLMRSVTACGGVSRGDLMRRLNTLQIEDDDLSERLPSPKIKGQDKFRDLLAVSIAGGRGEVRGGMVDPLPTLEPDLIGECFVLMSWEEFEVDKQLWCSPEQVISVAWKINPEQTAKFIRQMAQDYPESMKNFRWFPVTEGGE